MEASEIRQKVIADLTNVYVNTPVRDGNLEPRQTFPDAFGEDADFREAYIAALGMFLWYGLEMERLRGVSFLEYLQQQALLDAEGDEPGGAGD